MVATPASEKALEWLVAGFEKRGWKFTRVPEKLTLTTSFKEKNGSYSCLANVLTRPSGSPCVCFYSTAGLSVPEERHVTVAEFITRANWGLLSGNFEMDYPSGVVRYKTSCDLADGEMTVKMVEALVGQNLGTMDRYFPGLIKMIAGQTSPQAAVEEIERPTMSPASAAPPPKLATGGQTDREKKQLQELLDLAKAGGEDESKLDAIRQYWASATHEERTAYYKANIDTKPDADEKK